MSVCHMLTLQIFLFFLCTFLFLPHRIILNRDTLFISSVTPEDQGVYTCVASTSLDRVAAESQLVVLGKRVLSRCAGSSLQYRVPLRHCCLFAASGQLGYGTSVTPFRRGAVCVSPTNPQLHYPCNCLQWGC